MKSLYRLNQLLVVIATVLGLTFCSLVAMADQHRGKDGERGSRADRPRGPEHLAQLLNIEQSQKVRFMQIMQSAHQKRVAIMSQRLDQQNERAEMDALHRQVIAQLSDVLTEEQLQQFEQFAENNRPPRRH